LTEKYQVIENPLGGHVVGPFTLVPGPKNGSLKDGSLKDGSPKDESSEPSFVKLTVTENLSCNDTRTGAVVDIYQHAEGSKASYPKDIYEEIQKLKNSDVPEIGKLIKQIQDQGVSEKHSPCDDDLTRWVVDFFQSQCKPEPDEH